MKKQLAIDTQHILINQLYAVLDDKSQDYEFEAELLRQIKRVEKFFDRRYKK